MLPRYGCRSVLVFCERWALAQAHLRGAGRPCTPALRSLDLLCHGDLLLTGSHVGCRSILGAAECRPGGWGELQATGGAVRDSRGIRAGRLLRLSADLDHGLNRGLELFALQDLAVGDLAVVAGDQQLDALLAVLALLDDLALALRQVGVLDFAFRRGDR